MKERTSCIMEEHNCSSEQLEDALMQCGDLFDLVTLTQSLQDGHLDVYDMAERLTNLISRGEPINTMSTSEDEEEEDDSINDDDVGDVNGRCENDEEWLSGFVNGDRDQHLLLAGYSDCMTEALRYLVEEERYSPEHPVVEGLRTHLAQQQDRVLLEAARAHHRHLHHHNVGLLDNSRSAGSNNNNNPVLEVRNHVSCLADSICNFRPPAT